MCPHMCYHAEFSHSALKCVCINTGEQQKLVPWGTDGRLPLSDLDLGSGHTAYRRASLIDLYLHTKFHRDRKKHFFESHH